MSNLIKFFITVIIIFSTFSSYSKDLNLPKNLIIYEKIKANSNLTVIGHMTDKSDGVNLITRGDEIIPLKAQGWKAF